MTQATQNKPAPVKLTRISETPRCLTPSGIAVYEISIDSISIPPRTVHTCTPESIAALAQSIHKYGVIHPLTVRTAAGGGYELVSGERRLRAARLLGLCSVRCIVINTDGVRTDAMRLCENFHTVEPHFLDMAEAIGSFCDKYDASAEEAAARLCLSDRFVREKLRMLELSISERKLVRLSHLTEGQVSCILSIADRDARSILLEEVCTRALTPDETDRLVYAYLKKKRKKIKTRRETYLIRDVRIFYNTVDRAIDVMRRAGYNITAQKQDGEDATTVVIKIVHG